MNKVDELIKKLADKKDISEIIINSQTSIFLEKSGELLQLDYEIPAKEIESFAEKEAKRLGKVFNENSPILDGMLTDGSRINAIHRSYTQNSSAITIRRYLPLFTSLEDSGSRFGLSRDQISFFKSLIYAKKNILISGGTGSGKTTFLNLLLSEVKKTERMIVIEDTREVNVEHDNLIQLTSKTRKKAEDSCLTAEDLLKNALRMRPDRIIFGEVRGREVFDLIQALNTGHEGSMCTVHANSPREVFSRLESLFLLTGYDLPPKAIRTQLCGGIDFVIGLGRTSSKGRAVTYTIELTGMEGDRILTQDIIRYERGEGVKFTGLAPRCMQDLVDVGLGVDTFKF